MQRIGKAEQEEYLTSFASTRHGSKDTCEADNTKQCDRYNGDRHQGHGKFLSNTLYNHQHKNCYQTDFYLTLAQLAMNTHRNSHNAVLSLAPEPRKRQQKLC